MIEQGTPEWHAQRCGKVTASRIADIMREGRGGKPSATRERYMGELIAERLTGVQQEGFKSAEMQRGNEVEAEARAAYEFYSDVAVDLASFADHPNIGNTGASPDGLVSVDGLVEIKCPATHTHIQTLMTGIIDTDYITQMQWQMACTKRQWCDFVSFDPRMPENMQIFMSRVNRNNDLIKVFENAVIEFNREIDAKIVVLKRKYGTQIEGAANSVLMAG